MPFRAVVICVAVVCTAGCAPVGQQQSSEAPQPGVAATSPALKLEGTSEQALALRNYEKATAVALAALRAAERGELSDAEALLREAASEAVQLAPLLEQIQRLLRQLAETRAALANLNANHAQEIGQLREELEKRDQAIKRLRDLTLQQ